MWKNIEIIPHEFRFSIGFLLCSFTVVSSKYTDRHWFWYFKIY